MCFIYQPDLRVMLGYGYFDELVIPIIENTAWEHELADSLGQTIRENPKACAVLVRRHGMYVWGATWEQAKRHGECLHYLFEIAVNLRRLGLSDLCAPPSVYGSSKKRQRDAGIENPVEAPKYKYVIFDIEGTTTPITFVRDVLFPYASRNAEAFLNAHWTDHDCVNDIKALIELAGPGHNSATALAAFVRKVISEDSKISALKSLQGKIWREAYSSGNLTSIVYNDVAACFGRLSSLGSRIAIYSSGSRDAQRLLFKHSNNGDLTGYISCYFDTSLGHKRSPASYLEILMNIGLNASDVLFVTDILEEAQAAKISGMHAYLSVRPGNLSLPAIHDFKVISTFEEIDI
jgi:methylthioribulose 1-phosphate dehydratase/enolase-phosphatase E1